MTVNLSSLAGAGQQFLDDSGNVLTGGKLYSYQAGTTTPQTTYTDAAGLIAHSNPIILNAAGRVSTGEIWLTAGSNYKFVLRDSNDVLIATWDNITGINGTGITSNAVNVLYDPAGANAVQTTVQAKLRETVSVKDFGAVGDGVTDDRAAIQAAFDYIALKKGGTVYFPPTDNFYSINSTNPTYPQHGLVVLPGAGVGDIRILGNGLGNYIKLNVGAPITSLMYWPVRMDRMVIENMWFDANSLANHVLKADEVYHPYLHFVNSDFRSGLTQCIALATFVAVMDRVSTFRGTVGFKIGGVGSGPATSLTMNGCYALQASQYGYDFGFLTYCTLNSCAADGSAGSAWHTEIAYNFLATYGVTMNACGSEQVQRFLKITAYRGFVLNTAYMLGAGGESTPVDYLFEFVAGQNATVSGIRVNSQRPGGYTYLLGQTGSSFGSENITVMDASAGRFNSFWVSNFAFVRPIKFLRDDAVGKPQTINFSDAATLRKWISDYRNYTYDFDVTWQIADGTYDLETGNPFLQNLSGSGTLTIQGNALDNTAVKLLSSFNDFGFENCNMRIILKDLTVGGTLVSNSAYRLFARNSPNIILDNVIITRDGVNTGTAMFIEGGSKVALINGTIATATPGVFANTSFDVDDSSELVIEKASAPPATGYWSVGNIVYDDVPTSGGQIGWVCTVEGEAGTWNAFGAIA